MCWATFWANFSQTHLVTLVCIKELRLRSFLLPKEPIPPAGKSEYSGRFLKQKELPEASFQQHGL
jgi:hypothetical protein